MQLSRSVTSAPTPYDALAHPGPDGQRVLRGHGAERLSRGLYPWQLSGPRPRRRRLREAHAAARDSGQPSATGGVPRRPYAGRSSAQGQQVDPDVGGKVWAWQRAPLTQRWVDVNREAVPDCGPNGSRRSRSSVPSRSGGSRVKTATLANDPYCDGCSRPGSVSGGPDLGTLPYPSGSLTV